MEAEQIGVIALVVILLGAGLVYAAVWYYSSVKGPHHSVSYSVTLDINPAAGSTVSPGQAVTFNGTVKDSNQNPVNAASVHIYLTDSGGNVIADLVSSTTNSEGKYQTQWTVDRAGELYYKAGYQA